MLLSNGYEVSVWSACHLFAGYGHQEVTVVFLYDVFSRKFSVTITDMREVDRANEVLKDDDLDSFREILAGIVLDHCEDQVIEWIDSIEGGSHE